MSGNNTCPCTFSSAPEPSCTVLSCPILITWQGELLAAYTQDILSSCSGLVAAASTTRPAIASHESVGRCSLHFLASQKISIMPAAGLKSCRSRCKTTLSRLSILTADSQAPAQLFSPLPRYSRRPCFHEGLFGIWLPETTTPNITSSRLGTASGQAWERLCWLGP